MEENAEKKKGMFIEEDIKTRFDLSWNEKAVYTQIKYLTNSAGMLAIHNSTLSAQLGINEETVRKVLTSLFNKKLIMYKRKNKHSGDRYIFLYDKRLVSFAKQFGRDNKGLILEYKE